MGAQWWDREMIPAPTGLKPEWDRQICNIHLKMLYFLTVVSVMKEENRELSASSLQKGNKKLF